MMPELALALRDGGREDQPAFVPGGGAGVPAVGSFPAGPQDVVALGGYAPADPVSLAPRRRDAGGGDPLQRLAGGVGLDAELGQAGDEGRGPGGLPGWPDELADHHQQQRPGAARPRAAERITGHRSILIP